MADVVVVVVIVVPTLPIAYAISQINKYLIIIVDLQLFAQISCINYIYDSSRSKNGASEFGQNNWNTFSNIWVFCVYMCVRIWVNIDINLSMRTLLSHAINMLFN